MGKPTPCNACGMTLSGPCNHPRCWKRGRVSGEVANLRAENERVFADAVLMELQGVGLGPEGVNQQALRDVLGGLFRSLTGHTSRRRLDSAALDIRLSSHECKSIVGRRLAICAMLALSQGDRDEVIEYVRKVQK